MYYCQNHDASSKTSSLERLQARAPTGLDVKKIQLKKTFKFKVMLLVKRQTIAVLLHQIAVFVYTLLIFSYPSLLSVASDPQTSG